MFSPDEQGQLPLRDRSPDPDYRIFCAGDGLLKVEEQRHQQAKRLEEHHGRELAGGDFFQSLEFPVKSAVAFAGILGSERSLSTPGQEFSPQL